MADLLGVNITEKGNGHCQKCLNVKECDWDGGDCCIETCKKVIVEIDPDDSEDAPDVLSGTCLSRNMECLAPRSELPDYNCTSQLEIAVPDIGSGECNSTDSRIGNGLCNEELNFAECSYDGGDCCLLSCKVDGETPVLPFCASENMNCKDPLGGTDADTEAPTMKNLPLNTYTKFCSEAQLPTRPRVATTDNNPCFAQGLADFSETNSTSSDGHIITINRVWSVTDLSNNSDRFEQQLDFFAGDFRSWSEIVINDFVELDCVSPVNIGTCLQGLPSNGTTRVCSANDVEVAPLVTTTDNDACFVDSFDLAETISGAGEITVNRLWSVTDIAGNTDSWEQKITYFDQDIRTWSDPDTTMRFIEVGCSLDVKIDIHPGKDDKCIKIKGKGSLPMALFGTPALNVSLVDTESLELNGLVTE